MDAKIRIGADITQLQAGLAQARNDVSKWAGGITGFIAKAFATSAAVSALSSLTKEFANIADRAEQAGVSTRFLLSIKDDAEQTGTSLDTAARAVRKFISSLNDGKKSDEMEGVLKSLGTSVDELRGKKPEELFSVLAKAIAGAGTQADKLAVLNALLGDSSGKFEELLPLLEKVGRDGLASVSDELVKATESAAALDDELDGLIATVKGAVLPVFINFIKVIKLVGQLILAALVVPISALVEIIGAGSDIITAFGNLLAGMFELDDERIRRSFDKLGGELSKRFDTFTEDAKVSAKAIQEAFDDIGEGPKAIVDTQSQVNAELTKQLDTMRQQTAESKRLEEAEKARRKGLADWQKGQEDTVKGYEAELAAIEGAKEERKKSISDLTSQLAELQRLKDTGGGVIASSATQLGFGGAAVASVSQSKVEQLIGETNKQLSERKQEAAEIRRLIESIKQTLD